MTINNEENKYRELKESIRMINSQRRDIEKIIWLKTAKKKGINKVINRNETVNTYKMKSYCLKRRKDT